MKGQPYFLAIIVIIIIIIKYLKMSSAEIIITQRAKRKVIFSAKGDAII